MEIKKLIGMAAAGTVSGLKYRFNRAFNRPQLPTFLIYQITDQCNSKCNMCNIWKKEPGQELSSGESKDMLQKPVFSEIRWVNLTGGEPFMRKDLSSVIWDMSVLLPKLEGIAIPSNGFLTEHILKQTTEMSNIIPKNKFLSITLSIDGFETTHDKIRGVPGAYKKVMGTLDGLSKLKKKHRNFNVGVQPTISKDNLGEIKEFYKYIKTKTDSVGFAVMLTSEGYYENKGLPGLSKEDKYNVADFLLACVKTEPQYGFYYTKLAQMLKGKQRNFGCLGGFLTMFMDPRGEVGPCPVLSNNKDYLFGSGFQDNVWSTHWAKNARNKLKTEQICKTCTMMCDFINFAKVDFLQFSSFMLMHPKMLQQLIKKITNDKNPYF